MPFTEWFLKLTIAYLVVLPCAYLVIYFLFFSQHSKAIDHLQYLLVNWNTDFISEIYVIHKGEEDICPEQFEKVQLYYSNYSSQDYYDDEDLSSIAKNDYTLCIKRLQNSSIFDQYTNQQNLCSSGQRLCVYKEMSVCINVLEECPISDIIFSSQTTVEGYKRTGRKPVDGQYLQIMRESMSTRPLTYVALFSKQSSEIQKLKVQINEYKIFRQQLDSITLTPDNINNNIDFDNSLQKIDKQIGIDSLFNHRYSIYKQPVIQIQNRCIQEKYSLFQTKLVKYHHFHWFSYVVIVNKAIFILMQCFFGKDISTYPFSYFGVNFLIDAFFVFTTYYQTLDYYFTLEQVLSSGCFDSNGELLQMKSMFDLKYEYIGMSLNSLALLPVILIGIFSYVTFLIVIKFKKYVNKKFFEIRMKKSHYSNQLETTNIICESI